MPKIRKKTSKRVSINKRENLKKKVRDGRKKKSKEAKKNPQWKSKHAKDPGIPNNFPYKDQILAEVAEQRRQAAEEKQRRKDEKKAAKAQSEAGSAAASDAEEDAFDGVKALSTERIRSGPVPTDADDDVDMADAVDEDVPMLLNPDLPTLKSVLDAADAVVEVLDARDPLAVRSAHLEEVARELGKRVLLVLGKVDACPREAVEAWANTLRKEHPTVLFRSATACLPVLPADGVTTKAKGKGKERADDAWGVDAASTILRTWAEEKQGDEPFTVAVVGVTNVGKTSFINALLRKAALPTYRLASASPETQTTTTHPQEVTVDLEGGTQLRVIDTPGLSWVAAEDVSPQDVSRTRARDILLRNRGRIERLKDPSPVLAELVSRATREDLMLMYNLPIFTDGDANAFLAGVARANGFIKKKGEPDFTGASRMVLRDWSTGKLARYTLPISPSSASSSDIPFADVYAQDATILSQLPTRKELRKTGGLVKLRSNAVADARKIALDAAYFVDADDEGADWDEEDGGTVDDADEIGLDDEEGSEGDYVSDEDEEDGSDEEEIDEEEDDGENDEDELPPPPPRGKRKRVLAKAPVRPAKRVAFAPEPKDTKQARSAAGAKGAAAASKVKAKPKPAATKKPVKATPKTAVAKKVANAAPSKKAPAAAKDGEVAYDFKQFF